MEIANLSHVKASTYGALASVVLLAFVSACSEAPEQQAQTDQKPAQTASAPDMSPQPVEAPAANALPDTTQSTADSQAAEPATPDTDRAQTAAAGDPEPTAQDPDLVSSSETQTAAANAAPAFLVTADTGGVYWEPAPQAADLNSNLNSYAHLELTLASPTGKIINHRFAPGEPVGLGAASGTLHDGVYKWETVTAPVVEPHVRAEMAAVREAGDFAAEQTLIKEFRGQGLLPTEAQARANRQSGHFVVQNGQILPGDVGPGSRYDTQ